MKRIMEYLRIPLLTLSITLVLLGSPMQLIAQADAQAMLTLLAQKLDAKNGLRISYQYSFGNFQSEGVYYAKGRQFYLEDTALKSWYDGQNLWLFVPESNEVNLTTPRPEELSLLNPLLSLKDLNAELYDIKVTSRANGITLHATPKAKTSSAYPNTIEWLQLLVHADGTPISLDIKEQGMKDVVSLRVKKLQKGATKEMQEKSFFKHLPNKTKGAEVIDLR